VPLASGPLGQSPITKPLGIAPRRGAPEDRLLPAGGAAPERRPGDAYDDDLVPSRLLEFTRTERPVGGTDGDVEGAQKDAMAAGAFASVDKRPWSAKRFPWGARPRFVMR
jgi:hypothetical protein